MKQSFLAYFTLLSVLVVSASFSDKVHDNDCIGNNNEMTKLKIKIAGNAQVFAATLLDNKSAKAFKEMLPLTMQMIELNGNEKYGDLQNSLPTNPSNPKTVKNGDLMLYGSDTVVLFYKTFSTSYSYTKLGEVEEATGLASALGPGDIRVTFELEQVL
jgi:hypothetical protein